MVKRSKYSCGLKTTSNKTEVRKGGGRPPFHPLATTLLSNSIKCSILAPLFSGGINTLSDDKND